MNHTTQISDWWFQSKGSADTEMSDNIEKEGRIRYCRIDENWEVYKITSSGSQNKHVAGAKPQLRWKYYVIDRAVKAKKQVWKP